MKKLVFIAPHLSTGGMPQYLYKQIESLVNDYEIYCLEWDNHTGGKLIVQRNKIESLLGKRLITIGENKNTIIQYIDSIKPDIIHFQEVPEYFMQYEIAEKIYSTHRNYIILETSHDSSFDVSSKLHFPDKFLMVSNYQIKEFQKLGIPTELVEYPIEDKVRQKTREQILLELGLDPNIKHVINVGLFTPRKNQAEVIEYAKQLKDYPIQFHFIGNQADNFIHYWKPLMQDFPSNCKWWGERSDVDTFYQMADLFLFTSRGSNSDKETMPLVIREAISWNVPSLIYNLPVYLDYFDKYSNINYLNFDNLKENCDSIIYKLELKNNKIYTKDIKINSRWDMNEQKMYYSSNTGIDFPIIVSLKEYKSNAVLWSATYDALPKDIEFWMVPINKNLHDYTLDKGYSGIKLCIYKKENKEQIYEYPYFDKFANIPTISLSHNIPYRSNYIEFFVEKKYNKWFNGKKFKNVVDVGANVGVFTSFILHNKLSKEVVSVECDPLALVDLKENFDINPNVRIIDKALYHKNDLISFYQSEVNPVISSTIHPDKLKNHMAGIKGENELIVETITIRDLIDDMGYIDLLKIDIEGAEYGIINNIDTSLFRYINNLFIECHFFEDDCEDKYDSLISLLKTNGYHVEEYVQNQSKNKGTSECIFATKK